VHRRNSDSQQIGGFILPSVSSPILTLYIYTKPLIPGSSSTSNLGPNSPSLGRQYTFIIYPFSCGANVEPLSSFITIPFLASDPKAIEVVQIILESILLRREKDMRDSNGQRIVELPPKDVRKSGTTREVS